INFHGGGFGWYTPIAGTRQKGFEARPIYYGMLMFAEAGAGQMVKNTLSERQPEDAVAAYSLKTESGLRTVVFNKSGVSALRLVVDPGQKAERATMLMLRGASLDATSGVKLGDAAVDAHGEWRGAQRQNVSGKGGLFTLELPAASAALVDFK
ncbi:MAG: hypothetical protein ACRD3F_10925, partial [Acidobacteriaceae bacterium]